MTGKASSLAFTHEALPGRVVFGCGALRETAAELDRLGARRVLLLAASEEDDFAAEIAGLLGDRVVGRCDRVKQHVPVDSAAAARRALSACGADAVLTIGGGSATGLGKAVALEHPVHFLAIPTTYAGSEMTPIWGLSDGDRKRTGRDLRVLPDVVIYDPELTVTLPPAIAGPSGMNALAHCVEATYGPGSNPITTLQALEGIKALHRALPRVVARPDDLGGRTQALYGAYLAGCALAVAGTALHHKTCHVLGGMFNLGHGEMNAVILPDALRYNKPAIAQSYARIGDALGASDAAMALYHLCAEIGAPQSLAKIGMPADGITAAVPRIVEAASDNVRKPEPKAVLAMLTDAFEGRAPPV